MSDYESAARIGLVLNTQEEASHLKPGALTSPGLFLDRHDLQNFIFQR